MWWRVRWVMWWWTRLWFILRTKTMGWLRLGLIWNCMSMRMEVQGQTIAALGLIARLTALATPRATPQLMLIALIPIITVTTTLITVTTTLVKTIVHHHQSPATRTSSTCVLCWQYSTTHQSRTTKTCRATAFQHPHLPRSSLTSLSTTTPHLLKFTNRPIKKRPSTSLTPLIRFWLSDKFLSCSKNKP